MASANQRGGVDDENARRARIRAAFDMFDKDKKGCVIQECVCLCLFLSLWSIAMALMANSLCLYV